MDILRRNRPQLSFPGRSEATNILDTPGKGYHRLLNWQIQTTKVSWVGQSTKSKRAEGIVPNQNFCEDIQRLEEEKGSLLEIFRDIEKN